MAVAAVAVAIAAALASLQNAEFAYKVKLKMPVGMAKTTPKTKALKRAPKKPNECSSLSLCVSISLPLLTRQHEEEVHAQMPHSTSSWRWLWKPFDAALSRSERRSQNIYIDSQLLLPVLLLQLEFKYKLQALYI